MRIARRAGIARPENTAKPAGIRPCLVNIMRFLYDIVSLEHEKFERLAARTCRTLLETRSAAEAATKRVRFDAARFQLSAFSAQHSVLFL